MTPRAITFDVGGTLIAPWPSVGDVYAETAAHHGFPGVPAAAVNQRFAAAWRARKSFGYTRSEWAAIVDESFAGLTASPPSAAFFDDLYERFGQPGVWKIFDDVIPALTGLRDRGVKLGIISNWDDRLRPLLRALKLEDFFHSIVVSCETGACKPAPDIFERALRELGQPPGSVLHIGDSMSEDVEGAQAAGSSALLLDRSGMGGPGRIDSLMRLLPLMGH